MFRIDSKLFTIASFALLSMLAACEPQDGADTQVTESEDTITANAGSSTVLLLPVSTGIRRGIHYFVDNDTLTIGTGDLPVKARGIFAMGGNQLDGFMGLYKCNFADPAATATLTLEPGLCHIGQVTGFRTQPKLLGYFSKYAAGEFVHPLFLLRRGTEVRATANVSEKDRLLTLSSPFTLVRRIPTSDAIGYVVCFNGVCKDGS